MEAPLSRGFLRVTLCCERPLSEEGRVATRTAWADLYEELRGGELSELSPEELEALADAAWWTSRINESISARRKAYSGFAARGNRRRAAYSAWFLFWDHLFRGDTAVAGGWLRRAERDLAAEPECIEHGYLEFAHAELSLWDGEVEESLSAAERIQAIGERVGSPDLLALGLECRGRGRIAQGRIGEGVADLDEAMCSVIADELSPLFTGWIYCHVLVACWELTDLQRAAEWTDAALRWCEDLPSTDAPFRGLCRIHRVEIATLRGEWAEAEAQALRTSDELLSYEPHCAGMAFDAFGEVRRRMGDLEGAEVAFARAHELGHQPQPGLALVQLARGRIESAAAAIRLALASGAGEGFSRARLLSAQAQVALAAGDLRAATESVTELEALAGRLGTTAVQALAAGSTGALRLAEGDSDAAVPSLRAAVRAWQGLNAPYEAALARELLSTAVRLAGDEQGAQLELEVAHAVFERLGATSDMSRTARRLRGDTSFPAGLTTREVQVLRLVARGSTNREIAAQLTISEHTVARHLNNIFAKLDVSSRAAATAYAFTHGIVE
jgi:DNA-binding NarL/FixJ family response regulator